MWLLDPLSIATGGYVGRGPLITGFCPAPLAIGSDGYIRFEVRDRRDGDGGTGIRRIIQEREPRKAPGLPIETELAILALIAIEEDEPG